MAKYQPTIDLVDINWTHPLFRSVATIRRHLAKYSRLYLAGVAYDGVGIPDLIHAAEMTADALLDALANPAASAA